MVDFTYLRDVSNLLKQRGYYNPFTKYQQDIPAAFGEFISKKNRILQRWSKRNQKLQRFSGKESVFFPHLLFGIILVNLVIFLLAFLSWHLLGGSGTYTMLADNGHNIFELSRQTGDKTLHRQEPWVLQPPKNILESKLGGETSKYFLFFTPKIGEDVHFDSYFSEGVETTNHKTMICLEDHPI